MIASLMESALQPRPAPGAEPPAAPQPPSLSPQRLRTVLAFIDEHYAERLSVRQLADVVHLSAFHFARLFREAVGVPPHAYLTRVRMERAKELLANTDLALAEVAARVGYQTQAHFTGVLHRYVGTTPRAYRLRAQAQRQENEQP